MNIPPTPAEGTVWLDTSSSPAIRKVYKSNRWIEVPPYRRGDFLTCDYLEASGDEELTITEATQAHTSCSDWHAGGMPMPRPAKFDGDPNEFAFLWFLHRDGYHFELFLFSVDRWQKSPADADVVPATCLPLLRVCGTSGGECTKIDLANSKPADLEELSAAALFAFDLLERRGWKTPL